MRRGANQDDPNAQVRADDELSPAGGDDPPGGATPRGRVSAVVPKPDRDMPWIEASSMMPPPPSRSGVAPRPSAELPWIKSTSMMPPPTRLPTIPETPIPRSGSAARTVAGGPHRRRTGRVVLVALAGAVAGVLLAFAMFALLVPLLRR